MFYYHRCNGYSRCSGASLGLTVTDDAYTDQVGLVHDSTEGDTKSIAELTTFVDGSWSFCVDVTGAEQLIHAHIVGQKLDAHLGKPPGTLKPVTKL